MEGSSLSIWTTTPILSEAGKARALAQYSGPEREARKSGRFVSFSGLIYPQFSEGHVMPALDRIPPGVEVFRGVDPGLQAYVRGRVLLPG